MTRTDISHTDFSAKVEPFMQKIVRKLFVEIESVKTYVRVLVKCPNSRDTSDILFFTPFQYHNTTTTTNSISNTSEILEVVRLQ